MTLSEGAENAVIVDGFLCQESTPLGGSLACSAVDVDDAWPIAQKALLLDDLCDLAGYHLLPRRVAYLDFLQCISGENGQVLGGIALESSNASVVHEMPVELLQVWRNGKVLDRRQHAGRKIQKRIDIKAQIVLEEPAEALENSSL